MTMRSPRRIGRRGDCSRRVRTQGSTAVVVVAGDHGEAFGEHGEIAHSMFVYDTTLRVPLIFNGPGIGAQVSELAGLADRRRADARQAGGSGRRSTATASTCRRHSMAVRSRRVGSMRNRSRRCSTSAGVRCGRCARTDGSTSTRRGPSCSASTTTRASTRTWRRRRGPGLPPCASGSTATPQRRWSRPRSPTAKRRRGCRRWATSAVARAAVRPRGPIRRIAASWRRRSPGSRRASCAARRSSARCARCSSPTRAIRR